jgi:signal transduction histidine kinase
MSATKSSLNRRQDSSYRQSRIFLFAGFGGLLLLMSILGLSAISSIYRIELREEKIRNDYLVRDRALERLRSSTYLSGTFIRDFLLADDDRRAALSKAQFLEKQRALQAEIEGYRTLTTRQTRQPFLLFESNLISWFSTLRPVLEWDAGARRQKGYAFMQDQVLPRRTVVLESADRVEQAAERDLESSSEAVGNMVSDLRFRLMILIALTVLTGVVLAAVVLWRLLRLENESSLRFQEILKTREELKRLSAELLSAQETERRRISRELHDEVGQVLLAIALGLGSARSALKNDNREEVFRQLQILLEMIERNIAVVRNIALLLRPTMLDDLGLIPALKWLAREVSRSGSADVDFIPDAFLDELSEEHRTCIFRVVQEAVRNAARHSGARQIRIYLKQEASVIRASVQDDGHGFDPAQEKGLGMIGMQERVVHLGGQLRVDSEPGRGTIVLFELPLREAGGTRDTADGDSNNGDQVQIRPLRTA